MRTAGLNRTRTTLSLYNTIPALTFLALSCTLKMVEWLHFDHASSDLTRFIAFERASS